MTESIQHPLSCQWTFWKDETTQKNVSFEDYITNLKELSSCTSIESFWKSYAELPSLELLQDQKIMISFMKNGIKPLWEDLRNQNGSTITIKCHKNETAQLWKLLLVNVISNQPNEFITHTLINGVSVSMKRDNNILSLWINSTNAKQQSNAVKWILSLFPQLKQEDVIVKENKHHQSYSK